MTDAEIIAKDLSSTSAIESQQLQIAPGGISLHDEARKSSRWRSMAKQAMNWNSWWRLQLGDIHIWLILSICLTSHIDTNNYTYISYMKQSWIMDLMIWSCFNHFWVAPKPGKSQLCSHGLCTLSINKSWARSREPKNPTSFGQSWHHQNCDTKSKIILSPCIVGVVPNNGKITIFLRAALFFVVRKTKFGSRPFPLPLMPYYTFSILCSTSSKECQD